MRMMLALTLIGALASSASAAVTSTTQHGPAATSLNAQIAVGDAISALIGTELAPTNGWHPANGDPLDKLPAFTDDAGIRGTGLTGLLNDFPGAGNPAKSVQYDLSGPTDISAIQVLTGNNGKDGRVFSTFTLHTSSNNGSSYNFLGYFQSDLSGTANPGLWGSTLVTVYDNASGILASGVTNLQVRLYSVSNTAGRMDDPFDGVNPFTSVDDGFAAAFESPLVFEIDVVPVPEPATIGLLGSCGLAFALVARRRRAG